MDAKNKAKIQGILIGTGTIAVLIFLDKNFGGNVIEQLAGEYTVFAWIFIWVFTCGYSANARKKRLLADENSDEK